jgi:uncharacterized membrane protein YbhN (UPF0104 family)
LLVLYVVVQRARTLWDHDQLRDVQLHAQWLVLAGVVYVLGWLPSIWFWGALLRASGQHVAWTDVGRAYYCGHLGKYIPGKAAVLVIRAALLRGRGATASAAALTATCETLVMMGAGLAIGIVLIPQLVTPQNSMTPPGWLMTLADYPAVASAAVVVAIICLLPFAARWVVRLAGKVRGTPSLDAAPVISTRMLCVGLPAFALSWMLHGLSLQLTIRGVTAGTPPPVDWLSCTAAVSLATSIGFAALFAPGGIGIREGLLIELLSGQPGMGGHVAVAAAVCLRLVWLVSEVLVGSLLYATGIRTRPTDSS